MLKFVPRPLRNFLTKHSLTTFPTYLVIGLALFGIDLSIVLVLVELLGIDPALAQLVGRATGAAIGFVAHRHITFRETLENPRHGIAGQGSGYLLVGAATLLLSPFVLVGFLVLVGDHLVTAKILTECVLVLTTFISLRFVFRAERNANAAS